MRNIFLLFLFICITGSGWAQLLYPEVMEPRTPLNGPVVNKLTGLSFPPFLYKVRQENRTIENPGVRYAIQNLKKERYPEPQVNEAINTLIRYAEDERLKHVVEYLKRYAQTMGKKEQALETLEQKITYDSIEFYKNTEYLLILKNISIPIYRPLSTIFIRIPIIYGLGMPAGILSCWKS